MKISYCHFIQGHRDLLTLRFRLKIPVGDDPMFINEIHMESYVYNVGPPNDS